MLDLSLINPATSVAEAKERRAKLIEALRSGRYEQTRKVLHVEGGGYCCQGVACDILAPPGVNIWEPREELLKGSDLRPCDIIIRLPGDVHAESGGYHNWPAAVCVYYGFGMQDGDNLTALNDEGWTFEQIANVAEKLPYVTWNDIPLPEN